MSKDLKLVLLLLGRFLGVYFGLIILYQLYLNRYSDVVSDPLTRIIAEQSAFCLSKTGYSTQLIDGKVNEGIYFYIAGFYPVVMVEGCNAVSIIVLFLAFVFAFYRGIKTFWFVLVGLFFLYSINVLRIALLNIIILEFPGKYADIGHDYLFPAIIYGGVVLFWIIWIKIFVLKK